MCGRMTQTTDPAEVARTQPVRRYSPGRCCRAVVSPMPSS